MTAAPPLVVARRRNPLGIAALVLALVVALAPLVTWIAVAIAAAIDSPTADDAVYVGFLGGFIAFAGVWGIASPLAVVAAGLGIASLFRPGSKAPGITAIVLGAIGSIGLFWIAFVLSEVVPGW